jgi:hypothetical protein
VAIPSDGHPERTPGCPPRPLRYVFSAGGPGFGYHLCPPARAPEVLGYRQTREGRLCVSLPCPAEGRCSIFGRISFATQLKQQTLRIECLTSTRTHVRIAQHVRKHASLQSMPWPSLCLCPARTPAGLLQQHKGRKPGGPARRCIAVYLGCTVLDTPACFLLPNQKPNAARNTARGLGSRVRAWGPVRTTWGAPKRPSSLAGGGAALHTALLVEERV